MTPLVEVSGLRVTATNDRGAETDIVRDIGFTVARGEVLALIGESGSGKTTIALSLLGYARRGCRIADGGIRVGGADVRALAPAELARLRGGQVAYVAQSAAAAFNPSQRLMDQVIEGVRMRGLMSRANAEAKARDLFRALALPEPDRIGARFPHQVSGGQLQRLMAAMALMTDPDLVVFDEPTTALDVTTQVEVLRAFREAVRERKTTAIYVSHDLAVVAQVADRIVVLRDGAIQEIGATAQILSGPADPYTQSLLAAHAPKPQPPAAPRDVAVAPLLEVRGLVAGYGATWQGRPAAPVLHDVDLEIRAGSALGVIGESGSGKSTLARVIAGLLPATSGMMRLDGERLAPALASRGREELRRIQIVFQAADTALNPAHSVERILSRPLAFYHGLSRSEQRRRVRRLLDLVRLPASLLDRLPTELSGGQKTRVNLARALAAEPALLLCDEVTASLDTVVGAAILDLLAELRSELGLALMFISHDLKTVRAVCDEVMVLYAGQVMERGTGQAVMQAPQHPYADLLAASVPELRPGWLDSIDETRLAEARSRFSFPGSPDLCAFISRCAARAPGLCDAAPPPIRRFAKGSDIRCHRTEQELVALQSKHGSVSAAILPLKRVVKRAL
ncbi:MAG: ABC transporter ATP-binding protein [Proteobacteria bacterium]|nr:ABC transporter ATP-binding protein [Pseudomonadota bacterium]